MNIKKFFLNDQWILFFFASLLTVVLIVAVINLKANKSINDIQSFKVIYLDEGTEIYSDNPKYCRFLEMYFDSFSINEIELIEEYKTKNLEEKHSIKVEVSCLNDVNYVVYLDTTNEISQNKEHELFNREPTKWIVENVKGSNVFVIPGAHSSKLVKIFTEINYK